MSVQELPCGCVEQHVLAGTIVVKFCADHLISRDPFGVIPRERPETTVLCEPEECGRERTYYALQGTWRCDACGEGL